MGRRACGIRWHMSSQRPTAIRMMGHHWKMLMSKFTTPRLFARNRTPSASIKQPKNTPDPKRPGPLMPGIITTASIPSSRALQFFRFDCCPLCDLSFSRRLGFGFAGQSVRERFNLYYRVFRFGDVNVVSFLMGMCRALRRMPLTTSLMQPAMLSYLLIP